MRKGTIAFKLDDWDGQLLQLDVSHSGSETQLWFKADRPFALDGDALAIALSTLCGREFSKIDYGFEVSALVANGIAAWTGSHVEVEETVDEFEPFERTADNAVLNFSGGFDSLAALQLLPSGSELVSMDFGGRFARERRFFSKFETRIISTNLVSTDLRKNSWSFMGMGPLLLSRSIQSRYFSFGSILEAGGLRLREPMKANATFPPFALAGYQNAAPVSGISEAGTVKILMHSCPDYIAESLSSLASPGEEKLHRKIALAKAVSQIYGENLDLPSLPRNPRIHFDFGDNFTVDLTSLFFVATGFPEYARAIVRNPPELETLGLKPSDFEFMLKVDSNYYAAYPPELRATLNSGVRENGLDWYSSTDFAAVERVKTALSKAQR